MSGGNYDLIVVGAGLAGLWAAVHALEDAPSARVVVLEASDRVGGRVATHWEAVPGKGRYQWEAGAGRIPVHHRRVIGLIKKYGLTFRRWGPSPLPGFSELVDVYLRPLEALGTRLLGRRTLSEVMREVYGAKAIALARRFPYWAEFETLRADCALEALLRGALAPGVIYGGCVEGLSVLVERMAADVRERGEIRMDTAVLGVYPLQEGVEVETASGVLRGKRVVVAIPAHAMRRVEGLKGLGFLRRLGSEPLMRVYAVFPTHGGGAWFSAEDRRVVADGVRFFIPMDAKRGLAMISYTEGRDTRRWMRMEEAERTRAILAELRELFDREIPDPLVVRYHYWEHGCTYWLPGDYDVRAVQKEARHPLPGLYVCGESVALEQAWMEGAVAPSPPS
jgi:protoporphyrinogen oxidase